MRVNEARDAPATRISNFGFMMFVTDYGTAIVPNYICTLLRLARRGMPLRAVRLFFEMVAGDEGLLQVHRIFHNDGIDQIRVAVGLHGAIDVLGDLGVGAVGDAVLAEVAGFHVSGDDLERAALRRRCRPAATAGGGDGLPLGFGVSLPAGFARGELLDAEVEEAGLGT